MNVRKSSPQEDHSGHKLIKLFSQITQTISNRVAAEPLDEYSKILWTSSPIELKGPRFGASSRLDEDNQLILELSNQLLTLHKELFEPILWRVAFLLHLPRNVRKVPESSDLGLYCYYRFGLPQNNEKNSNNYGKAFPRHKDMIIIITIRLLDFQSLIKALMANSFRR